MDSTAPAPVQAAMTARRVDLGSPRGYTPQVSQGAQLAKALASFIDPVSALVRQNNAEKAKAQAIKDREDAENAADVGLAQGLSVAPGAKDERALPPEAVNPAYGKAYAKGLGLGTASKIVADYSLKYETAKNSEGFDIEKFIQEVDKEYAGATDPEMLAVFSQSKVGFYDRLRGNFADVKLKQLREASDKSLNEALPALLPDTAIGSFNDNMAEEGEARAAAEWAEMRAQGDAAVNAPNSAAADSAIPLLEPMEVIGKRPPAEDAVGVSIHGKWLVYKELGAGLQKTTPELAEKFLQHLANQSVKLNGRPDLYDFADIKDDAGMSLSLSNPKIAETILNLKAQAAKQRQDFIVNGAQRGNEETLIEFNSALETGAWDKISDDKLWDAYGPAGVFNNPGELAAFITTRNKAQREDAGDMQALAIYSQGMGATLDPDRQQKLLDKLTAPILTKLYSAQTDAEKSLAISGLMAIHAKGGMPAHKGIKNWLSGVATTDLLDPKNQADFVYKAKAYNTLKATAGPAMATAYVSSEAREMFEEYWLLREDYRQDDTMAMQGVVAWQDPKKRAEAKEFANTPEFKKGTAGSVKEILGDINPNWIQRNLNVPFTSIELLRGKAENTLFLQSELTGAVQDYRMRHPHAPQSQIAKWAESWITSHVGYEKETNSFIRLAPEDNHKATLDGMAWMAKQVKATSDPIKGSTVFWSQTGGKYQLVSMFPDAILSPPMTPSEITRSHYAAKSFSQAEAIEMKGLVQAARAGTATREMVAPYAALLQKANNHGLVPKSDLDVLNSKVDAPGSMPKTTFGSVQDAATHRPKALKSFERNQTQTMVSEAMKNDDPTFALIAAGETYKDTVYIDPNHAAGANLAFGYNIKAAKQAGHYEKDMRQSGIPLDQLTAIENGKVRLSPDQVTRLTKIAIKRAEDEAQKDFDGLVKNRAEAQPSRYRLWTQLHKREQAYLTDVVYQTGTLLKARKGTDKLDFADGVWAMSEGIYEGVKKSFVLKYKKGEQYVTDYRRNNLRNSMLDGKGLFLSTAQHELGN